jgi:dipeptidyl aminopeptidase/acylaminoacyl peptidase
MLPFTHFIKEETMKRLSSLSFVSFIIFYLLLASTNVLAQQKRPLDHDSYDIWNRITRSSISNNGQWVLFTLGPEDKDGELRMRDVNSDRLHTMSRGDSAQFSNDSQFTVFLIRAFKDSLKKAKREEKKPEQMPKDAMGIIDLSSGEIIKTARVKSFKLPKEGSGWVAYLLEKAEAKKDTTAKTEQAKKEESKKDKKDDKKRKKAEGTDLFLRNLKSGVESSYTDVVSFDFSEDGKWLVYTASNKDSTADGIFAVETNSGAVTTILTGKGDYKQAAIAKSGSQVAFLSNRDDIHSEQPSYTLYHWRAGSAELAAIAKEGTDGMPYGWWISEHGEVSFSENGKRVFFGTAPRPEPEPDEEEPDEEKVKVDIWNWKDPELQPMQLVRLKNEQKRSYQAVAHLGSKKVVQLATKEVPEVKVGEKGDGDLAIANSNMPYRQEISWDSPRYYDVHLIDVATGSRRLVIERLQASAQLSPESNYIAWWNRGELAWYAMDVKGNRPINLTARITHPVYYELHDWPFKPNPYGFAGWTEKDKEFLIYDNHDIWAVDPSGKKAPRNVTEGVGRAENLRIRYIKLDPEEEAISRDSQIILSAFHHKNKQAGFYRDQIEGNQRPTELTMTDKYFSTLRKAKNSEHLLFTRSDFVEFPDLWASNLDLSDMRKVSDANPQQSEYLWGTAELVEWSSLDGVPLQGILYKPENFDPGKKYPMMVYFYERMSNGLHRHRPPATARSSISFSFYVSRGYLVFVPDIPYKVGFPGQSALNAVVPGVLHLQSLGFVDEENIGVQGHSWGGYQISYLVTRTNIFKAAEAGAPVSNMISAYGGIRWGSGMSRMFQYERTQSRIGGSLWEYPMRYMENSPIFWADKIETPLLMMHNDEDTAVPWYQGIELFVALRRLGKPAWMLNYNGEKHGLGKFQNKRDWAIRMQQFFDHYLKGAPAPVWLEEGLPAIRKGKTLGLEPASAEITKK